MSLATRLSLFFLLALAFVLAGFSGTLYLLARNDLTGQLNERLQHGLDTLEASVDIEPGGLEWEPADRQITLGSDTNASAVRWAIRDGDGALVDRSANVDGDRFPWRWSPSRWPSNPVDGISFGSAPGWRLAARRLQLQDLLRQGRGHPDDEPGYEVQYTSLTLIVGLSPAPVDAALGKLGLALVVLSLVVWIVSLAAGQWLCQRALMPVSAMARAAKVMTAADLGQRLPITQTGDELDALGQTFNGLLDRLHEAFTRLEAAYVAQGRFAAAASHQLRNPLAALLGQVQVALRRTRSPEDYQRVLERVLDEGNRLREIVESLLLLAHPDELRPETQLLDLRDWIPEHLDRWGAHPRSGELRFECTGESLIVHAHPALLAQLLDNLLDNAFKYRNPGTDVVVRTWREENRVMLGVASRGSGLTAADRPHVFEPFFRGDQARREGHAGVGLGLAVAQQIAAAFGGAIDVRGETPDICFFVLRLPAAPENGVPSQEAAIARDRHVQSS